MKQVTTVLLVLGLGGCATDITKKARSVELVESEASTTIELTEAVPFKLTSGRVRNGLRAGSRWKSVGTIPQGTVYRPLDSLLQVRTGHAYEAFVVLDGTALVGVYLPVEDSFVESRETIEITFEETQ